jgi:hypothetical protein
VPKVLKLSSEVSECKPLAFGIKPRIAILVHNGIVKPAGAYTRSLQSST